MLKYASNKIPISFDDFKKFRKSVGSGVFGDIVLMQQKETEKFFACKSWNLAKI